VSDKPPAAILPAHPSGASVPRGGRFHPNAHVVAALGCAAACLLAAWQAPIVPGVRGAPGARWGWWTGRAATGRQAAAAESMMRRAETVVRDAKRQAGVGPDADALSDPSGLIGGELTPLVTTLGSLEAKRTAVNPMWAAVLTRELAARGIVRGDFLAASFSGSFPGLNLAVMSAAEALGAEVAAVSTVTASTWGANQPGFTWPEIEARVVRARVLRRASVAIAAGGEGDLALDLEGEGRSLAWAIRDACARELGVPTLAPAGPRDAVARRMAIYRRAANGRRVALYINVGGAAASLGASTAVLRLRSGFLAPLPFDRSEDRGVMARFAEQGVTVLTLLNIRDLALRWGVPLG
jgi:poly-gamma-glutamate system protein